jgi:hypothetical protein
MFLVLLADCRLDVGPFSIVANGGLIPPPPPASAPPKANPQLGQSISIKATVYRQLYIFIL